MSTAERTHPPSEPVDRLPWRSLLYVPTTVERFVRKAAGVGADAVQLDLEDSIAPDQKAAARAALPAAVETLTASGVDVVVRVNHPARLLIRDLETCARPGVCAVAVPKLADPDRVRMVDEVLADLEAERGLPPGGIRVIGMIETPAGLFAAKAIAHATPRLLALTLGTEDFASASGIRPDPDLVAGACQQVVYAARSAGLWPLGLAGSVAGFADLPSFRRIAMESKRIGYVGASAVHPSQIPVLHEAFTPSASEVDAAQRLLESFDEALARGVGAIRVHGSMVDEPVARRARRLVAVAEQYRSRDTRR